MEQKQLVKQMLEFNQTTFNNAFDAMVLLQDQFESMANTALDQAPGLPAEGRKVVDNWSEVFKEGRKNLKQQIGIGFEQAEKLLIQEIKAAPAKPKKAATEEKKAAPVKKQSKQATQ